MVVSESFPCLAASGRGATTRSLVARGRTRAASGAAGGVVGGTFGVARTGGAAATSPRRRLASRTEMARAAGVPCGVRSGGTTAARSAAARRELIFATASASSQAVERRPSMSIPGGNIGLGRTYWDCRTCTPARRAPSATRRRSSRACCGTCTRTG